MEIHWQIIKTNFWSKAHRPIHNKAAEKNSSITGSKAANHYLDHFEFSKLDEELDVLYQTTFSESELNLSAKAQVCLPQKISLFN